MSKKAKAASRAKAAAKTPRRFSASPPAVARTSRTKAVAEAAAPSTATEIAEIAPAGEIVIAKPAASIDFAALAAQLRDHWAETAVAAAEQLGDSGDARAVTPLLAALANVDGYYHLVTRAAAAMALGRLGEAGGIGAVEGLLVAAHDPAAEVSAEAVLALGACRSHAATATLVEIVANNSGYYLGSVRHAALRALGRLGDPAAREVVAAVANNAWEVPAILAAANEALSAL